MLAYTVVFYLFTTRRRDTIRISSISFIFLCLVLIYASIEEDHLQATERIGFIGIGVSLVFFASPLANLAHVVRVKNSESLPFSMIVSSFVVTLLWFIYGNLIGDYFIQGMFLSTSIKIIFNLQKIISFSNFWHSPELYRLCPTRVATHAVRCLSKQSFQSWWSFIQTLANVGTSIKILISKKKFSKNNKHHIW